MEREFTSGNLDYVERWVHAQPRYEAAKARVEELECALRAADPLRVDPLQSAPRYVQAVEEALARRERLEGELEQARHILQAEEVALVAEIVQTAQHWVKMGPR